MKPLRVFLSSTAVDLVDHRKTADDTLLRLQQQSVAMERWGPLPGATTDECERMAADCDALICIVAHRHGYEPEAGKGSITRREVEAARRAGKPVYAWIVDEAHPWTDVKESDRLGNREVIDGGQAEALAVFAAVQALQDFKTWLRAQVTTETFTSPDDLGRKIATTVAHLATQRISASGAASASAGRRAELRIVHALQPAPHFRGRDVLVEQLSAWVDDGASPDRVQALVATGGTGKTAVVQQVVERLGTRWPKPDAEPLPGAGNVLVWSFYERPEADIFLRECGQLFLGEADDAAPGGRLERLQRGLRDGRPHLLVLDGLERVQADTGHGRVHGELEDHQLRMLLRAIAAGLGRTRALVTSRFRLTDLSDWQGRGVVETQLDDLPTESARAVLRGWGVRGDDAALEVVSAQVGCHALSVAVIGSYLSHFEDGRIEAAARFRLDEAAGDDPKAAKLARVLGYYAERLSVEERDLLARLAVFPRGITLEVLGVLTRAGGRVAGVLSNSGSALRKLLQLLVDRGLVFSYKASDRTVTWTAHPFVRERFAGMLGCPAENVFNVIAGHVGQGLAKRPENKPTDAAALDRYEQAIEMTRLAGGAEEALDLYWFGMGGFAHIGGRLGDYARGHRVLRGFVRPEGETWAVVPGLTERRQAIVLNELAQFSRRLGRLADASVLRRNSDALFRRLKQSDHICIGLLSTSLVAYDLGQLAEARGAATRAFAEANRADDEALRGVTLAIGALVAHRFGDIAAAEDAGASALKFAQLPYVRSRVDEVLVRHHVDLGNARAVREIVDIALSRSRLDNSNEEIPGWHAALARVSLAEGTDPTEHLAEMRSWTARTGDMALVVEANDLCARAALARGDLASAKAEAEDGLREARLCGYRLLTIELLVTLSAIHLAWPSSNNSLTSASEALDLAAGPDCGDAWGEADAAHALGLAFVALGETDHARRAFMRALPVRERIRHPQTQVTRDALGRLDG